MFCKFRMHFSTGVTTRWGLLHVQDFVAIKVTINQLKMKCMQVPVVYVNNYNYLLQKLHKHASPNSATKLPSNGYSSLIE